MITPSSHLALLTSSRDLITRCFDATGPLASAFPHYCPRTAQIEMAQAVSQAIDMHASVVLEAGTGVGKTAAYLVPAMHHGGKVIISTGTKTLQDQLFDRDLPALKQALALPVQIALLKGRSNYVCHHHLERAQTQGLLNSAQEVRDLRQVVNFTALTQTGDRTQCSTVSEQASIWSKVTSTRENCLGSECGFHSQCFVLKARRLAQDADIVVVNHHLFFADLMLREEGVPELLPQAQTVIFDEAHQLPHIAPLFFSQTVSSAQILDWCRDVLAEGLTSARDALNWPQVLGPLEGSTREVRLAFDTPSQKMSADQLPLDHALWSSMQTLEREFKAVLSLLEPQAVRTPALEALHQRGTQLLDSLVAWRTQKYPAEHALERAQENAQDASTGRPAGSNPITATAHQHLYWVEVTRAYVQWLRTPVSIADIFKRQRLGTLTAPAPARSWIFTSATLSVKEDFSHFVRELGLDDCSHRAWPSPFDYPRLALLYVPPDLPMPQDPRHTEAVVQAALPLIRTARGRTFFLCTTHRALELAAQLLRLAFETHADDLQVLQQNTAPKAQLLERFRLESHSVLVGSHSFWEGVDVAGQALSLVIIDKLPFAPPDDPVVAKRLQMMQAAGEHPFMHYQVPQAIIALKQGAGRLIRSESDRGVLMIADPRLIEKNYGRRMWQSLPPMRRSRVLGDALAHLATLHTVPDPATTATSAPTSPQSDAMAATSLASSGSDL